MKRQNDTLEQDADQLRSLSSSDTYDSIYDDVFYSIEGKERPGIKPIHKKDKRGSFEFSVDLHIGCSKRIIKYCSVLSEYLAIRASIFKIKGIDANSSVEDRINANKAIKATNLLINLDREFIRLILFTATMAAHLLDSQGNFLHTAYYLNNYFAKLTGSNAVSLLKGVDTIIDEAVDGLKQRHELLRLCFGLNISKEFRENFFKKYQREFQSVNRDLYPIIAAHILRFTHGDFSTALNVMYDIVNSSPYYSRLSSDVLDLDLMYHIRSAKDQLEELPAEDNNILEADYAEMKAILFKEYGLRTIVPAPGRG